VVESLFCEIGVVHPLPRRVGHAQIVVHAHRQVP
jgi:hypothetical protein